MIQLQSPKQPYPDISYIGIAIKGDVNQRHVGVLFRTDKNHEPRLLHLAFHLNLKCDNPSEYANEYFGLCCPGFDDDDQLQLAVWFEKIFLVNGKRVPYSLAYSSIEHFSQSGAFIQSEKNSGLTCATLVMALFEDFGFPIIDTASWLSRDDDKTWHEHIIGVMKQYSWLCSDTHIDSQISNIGVAVRFRPEEVAVSAYIFNDNPVTFQEAEPLAKNLLEQMNIGS
jgi:hypothetical protein